MKMQCNNKDQKQKGLNMESNERKRVVPEE